MNEEIDILLSRYFSGEATKKELRYVDAWLSESDENEKYFHQMTQLYELTGQVAVFPATETEKEWTKFKSYMSENKNNRQTIFLKMPVVWRAAAVLALVMVSAFALRYFIQPSNVVQLRAAESSQNYKLFENADVTLFTGAEIVYNKKNNHHIQLKGKAAFTIHSHDENELVVQAGETYIKDIGTIFTVDASFPDKSVTVDVTQGEVRFYTAENSGVHLKANQSAIYHSQSKQFQIIEKQDVVAKESVVGGLVFQNMPLNKAIDIIKTRYNTDIIVSKELEEVLLNVNFDKNESAEYILEIITETLPARLSKKDNTYIITTQ